MIPLVLFLAMATPIKIDAAADTLRLSEHTYAMSVPDAGAGPYYNGSNVYVLAVDRAGGTIEMWRSADSGATWAEVNAAGAPTFATLAAVNSGAYSAVQVGTLVHVVYGSDAGSVVALIDFDLESETWGMPDLGGPPLNSAEPVLLLAYRESLSDFLIVRGSTVRQLWKRSLITEEWTQIGTTFTTAGYKYETIASTVDADGNSQVHVFLVYNSGNAQNLYRYQIDHNDAVQAHFVAALSYSTGNPEDFLDSLCSANKTASTHVMGRAFADETELVVSAGTWMYALSNDDGAGIGGPDMLTGEKLVSVIRQWRWDLADMSVTVEELYRDVGSGAWGAIVQPRRTQGSATARVGSSLTTVYHLYQGGADERHGLWYRQESAGVWGDAVELHTISEAEADEGIVVYWALAITATGANFGVVFGKGDYTYTPGANEVPAAAPWYIGSAAAQLLCRYRAF